jgi:hypothetical protein
VTRLQLSSMFCAAAFMSASGWSTGDVALHRYALENSMTPRGVAVEAFPTRSSGKRYSIESVMTFAIARASLAMPCLLRVASCLGVRRLSFFDLGGGTSSGCSFDSNLSSAVDTDDRDALRGLARTVFGWPGVAEPGLDEEAAVAVVKSRKRLSTLARDILVHGRYDAELAQSFGPLLLDKAGFCGLPRAVSNPLLYAKSVSYLPWTSMSRARVDNRLRDLTTATAASSSSPCSATPGQPKTVRSPKRALSKCLAALGQGRFWCPAARGEQPAQRRTPRRKPCGAQRGFQAARRQRVDGEAWRPSLLYNPCRSGWTRCKARRRVPPGGSRCASGVRLGSMRPRPRWP